jgi:hypothetical protein
MTPEEQKAQWERQKPVIDLMQSSSCFGHEVCRFPPCACAQSLIDAVAVGDGMTDWNEVMDGYGGARPDDNDMVQITKGTARLARAAIHEQNEFDYYHNFGAAERELLTATRGVPP